MPRVIISTFFFFLSFSVLSQSSVVWGEELKVRKGTSDVAVINVDETGVYLEESHPALNKSYVVLFSLRVSATLVKLDKNFNEIYRNSFDAELKGKEYDRFLFIADKLYLFATSYNKKANSIFLYAAQVNKRSGQLMGTWKQVSAWENIGKREQVVFNITHNADSSAFAIASTITGRSDVRYEIRMFDASLKQLGKNIALSAEFDPETFTIGDLLYTPSGNIVLVGKLYEYLDNGRRRKRLEFSKYVIRIFDPAGKLIKEIDTEIGGRYLVSGKVIHDGNELLLSAFYSNHRRQKEINGMMVQRINSATGEVVMQTTKELNQSMTEVDDEEKSSKKKDDDEGLESDLEFRNFVVTPDNGLIIIAESHVRRHVVVTSTNSSGMSSSTSFFDHYSDDVYIARLSSTGEIEWLNVIPKSQYEREKTISGSTSGTFRRGSYFNRQNRNPMFTGFGSYASGDKIHIYMNDHSSNDNVTTAGQRVKRLRKLDKSVCYELLVDMKTGKLVRHSLFSNKNQPISMPRHGVILNNELFITGMELKAFGKTKIMVGRIRVKS